MRAEQNRVTISVTPSMDIALNRAKKECYEDTSQNGMFKDLIIRGLKSIESQERVEIVNSKKW